MASTTVYNGVSTIDEPRFSIYIKGDKGIKYLGVSTSKKDAIEVIRNIGRSELKEIMKGFDEKWTTFTVEFDQENGPVYKISVQSLGRVYNSAPIIHTTVYFEETKLLFPSEYIEEKPVEPPTEKPAEQPTEKPVEKPAGQPAEQTPGQAVEQHIEVAQLGDQTPAVPTEPLIN